MTDFNSILVTLALTCWYFHTEIVGAQLTSTGTGPSSFGGSLNFTGCLFSGNIGSSRILATIKRINGIYEADVCQAECQKQPGCGWFSLNLAGGICSLKWREVTELEESTVYVSGPRNCVGCFLTGEGYAADGCIDNISGVGCAVECQRHCALHAECVSFTYHPSESKCQLNAKSSRRGVNPNVISGPKHCPTCDCTVDD